MVIPTPLQVHCFGLPAQAIQLYSSAACVNQAFVYEERVIGLQFHLEVSPERVATLIANCRAELVPAPWIQSEEEMLVAEWVSFEDLHTWMGSLLDYLTLQG